MLNGTEKMNVNENDAPIVLLGEANFGAEVLQSKQPLLVAFWAPCTRPSKRSVALWRKSRQACSTERP